MIFLWILIGLLAMIAFLLLLPVHLIFDYHDNATIQIRVLWFRFDGIELFRRFASAKDEKPKQTKKGKEKPADGVGQQKKKNSGDFLGFIDFLFHIVDVINLATREFFSGADVYLKELFVYIGSDDAAQTAFFTSLATQAANGLCAVLQHFSKFRCDSEHLMIAPDFLSEQSRFSIRMTISTRVVSLLGLLIRTYIRFFEGKEKNYARNSVKTSH